MSSLPAPSTKAATSFGLSVEYEKEKVLANVSRRLPKEDVAFCVPGKENVNFCLSKLSSPLGVADVQSFSTMHTIGDTNGAIFSNL